MRAPAEAINELADIDPPTGIAWNLALSILQPLLDGSASPSGDGHWVLRWMESRGLPLVLAVMGALSWGLLKVRRYNSVAWLLVVFLFGMAAASTWFFGSVRTINIVLILMGLLTLGLGLLARTVQCARECVKLAGLGDGTLDAIYLTGGSSALVPLQRALRAEFSGVPLVEGDLFGGVAAGLVYSRA